MSEILSNPYVATMLKIVVLMYLMVFPLAASLTLLERKWSALIQDRIGPNRANVGKTTFSGLFHIVADGIKSAFKEDFILKGTNRFLFSIAPLIGFMSAFAVFSVIPVAAPIGDFAFQITDVDLGVIVLFAFTSLGVYGAVIAGWSTENKYGMLGSVRASAQMISYEVFLGLSLVGLFMVYGTVRIGELVAAQNEYWLAGWIPQWGIFTQPLAFFLFFTGMIAETKRAPFDAPEGESEIIAGYFIEYSGMRFASFFLAEYIAVVGVSCLMTTLFFGSYHLPWLHADGFRFGTVLHVPLPVWAVALLQVFTFTVKVVFFCWLQLMLRWSLPRFRFDQTMKLGWNKLLPLSIVNIVVTGFVVLLFS